MNILLPVDGSAHSDRAVRHVLQLVAKVPDYEVHLVNVQPAVGAWELRSHVSQSEIEAMQEVRGGDELKSARALLDAAGVHYTPSVLIGDVAKALAAYAAERNCDQVVMGTRGLKAVQEVLLGSVTTELIHLCPLPVTLVK